MTNARRLLCLVLAILTILSVLTAVSCGDGTEEGGSTTALRIDDRPDESGEEDTTPKFAEADYGGEPFTVYMRTASLTHYPGMYIFSPENATDLVNEQAAIRNNIVEERYNIEFKFIEAEQPRKTISNDMAGGEVPYDVVLDQRFGLGSLAYNGLLLNLKNLDINYDASWWDANAAAEYTYGGMLFIMPNDVSVSNISGCRFMWFNKEVLEDFSLTSPYEYVDQNQWTIDTFFQMVRSVSAPGPAGQIGVYGLANEQTNLRNFMLTGIGSFNVEYDSDNNIVCKIGTDYAEKTQDFFDKFKAVVNDSNMCIDFDTARSLDSGNRSKYPDEFYHTRVLFSQGHFLFVQTSMGGSLHFEEMEKGFGLVMNPKYNSDQEKYYHKIDTNAIIWTVPKVPGADLDRITNVMDFWAYTSSHTVMEAYYELTMKTKRASDPVTASMLDIIKDSIKYYITDIFSADISKFINASYNGSVSSAWKSYSKSLPRDLQKVRDQILAIDAE